MKPEHKLHYAPAPSRRKSSVASFLLVLIACVTVVLIGYIVLYRMQVHVPAMEDKALAADATARTLGLDQTAELRLAFPDADNDLVADPPTDPKDQLDPPALTFSYVAAGDPERFEPVWADFVAHLSKTTGTPATYSRLASTDEQFKALKNGSLHVTAFSTGAVPLAVARCGFVPAFELQGPAGKVSMIIITPKESSLRTVNDLRGHTLTLVEVSSNSGFKAPIVLLKSDFGLWPDKDYRFELSGSHEKSIAAVAAKKTDAAAVASDVLAREVAGERIAKDQYRELFVSEPFPPAALGYTHRLKPELAAKVRSAFETFVWPNSSLEKGFAGAGLDHFAPVDYKKSFAAVRRINSAIRTEHKVD